MTLLAIVFFFCSEDVMCFFLMFDRLTKTTTTTTNKQATAKHIWVNFKGLMINAVKGINFILSFQETLHFMILVEAAE